MIEPKADDTFRAGQVLNNTWEIEGILGRGGTSEVYRARNVVNSRISALKVLNSRFSANTDFLALMNREEEMRDIRHPAVVRYSENNRTAEGHVYLVMDFIDGPALSDMMKSGPVPADQLIMIAQRVAEGLVATHEHGVVHRDLSPDNIILRNGEPAQAVIIDFGIAKDTKPEAETIVGNEFAGKYQYAAPEQLSGQADARADIYALGATLLAAFRGKAPDVGRNPMDVIQFKSRTLDTNGVPEPFRALIGAMTVVSVEGRLQTALDVIYQIDPDYQPMGYGRTIAPRAASVPDETVIMGRGPGPTIAQPPPSQPPVSQPPGSVPPAGPPSPVPPASVPPSQPASVMSTPPMSALSDDDDPVAALLAEPAPSTQVSPPPPTPPEPEPVRKSGSGIWVILVVALLGGGGAGAYFSGILDTIISPSTAPISPYTLTASQAEGGTPVLTGFVPDAVAERRLGAEFPGNADIRVGSGAPTETYIEDMIWFLGTLTRLQSWELNVSDTQVVITGATTDKAVRDGVIARLDSNEAPQGYELSVSIELNGTMLPASDVREVLADFESCGPLRLTTPEGGVFDETTGLTVQGHIADPQDRARMFDTLRELAGERRLTLDVTALNIPVCLARAALPPAPTGSARLFYAKGDDSTENPSGVFLEGENPIIDVTFPADETRGDLWVSYVNIDGVVTHMLPEPDKPTAIRDLGEIRNNTRRIRVAHKIGSDALIQFNVAPPFGTGEIIVFHTSSKMFDAARPIQEPVEDFTAALRDRLQSPDIEFYGIGTFDITTRPK